MFLARFWERAYDRPDTNVPMVPICWKEIERRIILYERFPLQMIVMLHICTIVYGHPCMCGPYYQCDQI